MSSSTTSSRYHATRHQALKNGTWRRRVPRDEAVQLINSIGKPIGRIAAESGVDRKTLRCIVDGTTQSVQAATMDQLKTVEPDDGIRRPTRCGYVLVLGTVRQLRALAAIGRGTGEIAAATGVAAGTLSHLANGTHGNKHVSIRVAAAVDEIYDRWECNPRTDRYGRHIARRAAALGWKDPRGWDTDTIHNPGARWTLNGPRVHRADYLQSNVDDALRGDIGYADLTTTESVQVVRILAGRGWVDERIGKWLRWGDSSAGQQADNVAHFRRRWNIPAASYLARLADAEERRQLDRYISGQPQRTAAA